MKVRSNYDILMIGHYFYVLNLHEGDNCSVLVRIYAERGGDITAFWRRQGILVDF